MIALTVGCSQSTTLFTNQSTNQSTGQPTAVAPAKLEPVTLTILTTQPLTDEEFDKYILTPLHNKYPHITLTRTTGNFATYKQTVVDGNMPDLLYASPYLNRIGVDDAFYDLTPLVKKQNMDLSRLDPTLLESVKKYGQNGQIVSIPFVQNTVALFYNKDLFDRAGVEYPKDGMSWNDVADLARKMQGKLTSSSNESPFRALDPYYNNAFNLGSSYSAEVYDPKTGKAIINPIWGKTFQFMMDVFNIPGNKPAKLASNASDFYAGNTAMIPQFYNSILDNALNGKIQFNWNVVQYPDFPDKKGVAHQVDFHQFVVSSTSKHAEDALRVIEVATSSEVQLEASMMGKIPALNDSSLLKSFGSGVPQLKGKNIQSMFKSKSAPLIRLDQYTDLVTNQLTAAFTDVFNGNADINTALRTAEEKANADIATQNSGK
ncbi:MAG: transporter substrate-binding protein [Paenibacillaceae bacterium]|nr:transporter substrate-binding protein [Paenibacillaceae bacterium]